MTAFLITVVICLTFLFITGTICMFFRDSVADYLEAKADELRARADTLKKEAK